jgi:hypothetical protein
VDLYVHTPIRLHGVVLSLLSTGTTLPRVRIEKRSSPADVREIETKTRWSRNVARMVVITDTGTQ